LKEESSPEGQYLQPFVFLEASLNCQPLNLDDNKKTLKKYKKEEILPWFPKYCSTSRTIFRGAWFFNFIGKLMSMFVSDKSMMMSKMALKAYDEALGPHHSRMLKMAAHVAMKAIKKREKFIVCLTEEQTKVTGKPYSEDMLYTDLEKLGKQAALLSEQLWAFCRANGLDKLP